METKDGVEVNCKEEVEIERDLSAAREEAAETERNIGWAVLIYFLALFVIYGIMLLWALATGHPLPTP